MSGDPTRVAGIAENEDRPDPGPTPAAFNGTGHAVGTNAQSGLPSGTETERDAPGLSTDKRGDDVG